MGNLQCEPLGSGNSIAGHLAFANSIDAIDYHGDFDRAIDGSDCPAAFLGGYCKSAYGHWGSGNSITGHLGFAYSIDTIYFPDNFNLIVKLIAEKFLMVLVNLDMDIQALVIFLQVTVVY